MDLFLGRLFEALRWRRVPRLIDCPPSSAHCQRRLSGQALSELGGCGLQVSVRDHTVRQPNPERLGGVDDFA
jgi:hypothetical protein